MAATGWWFILWLWAPIYGNILAVQFFEPLWATLKWTWPNGGAAVVRHAHRVFVVTLITIALAGLLVSLGHGRLRADPEVVLLGGLVGFAVIVVLLLINSHASFVSSFNLEAHKLFGINNAYRATNAAAAKDGYIAPKLGFGPLGPTHAAGARDDVLPPVAELGRHAVRRDPRGERLQARVHRHVRRAVDHRRCCPSRLPAAGRQDLRLGLLPERQRGRLQPGNPAPLPIWPYPVMFAGWLVHNTAFQVILILVMSLWFFGWVGTLFLSSTRVIFAAAFDRVLPDRAAEVSREAEGAGLLAGPDAAARGRARARVYAYNSTFRTYTLDATLVIAVTYLFSAIAVVILPWRKPDLWRGLAGQPDQGARRADRAAGGLGHDRAASASTSTSG